MTKSMQLPTTTTQQQQQLQPKPDNDMDNSNNNNNNNCTVTSSKKKKKHKKKSKSTSSKTTDFTAKTQTDFAAKTQADMVDAMMNHHVIRHGDHKDSHHISKNNTGKIKEEDSFWSSSNNTEERQKIREFWLQLGEDERRSLVKVEKEAVLRKMKEQQKHSCNCSVCGKKRTAIEDELEVLYDAYYEELEQYANHQQQTRGSVNPLHAGYLPSETMYDHGYDDTDHLDEDDEDEDEDEEEEDDDDDDLEEEEEEEEEEDEEDEEDDEEEDDDEDEDDEDDDDADDDDEIITRPPIATYAERSRFEEMTHIRHTPLSRASPNGDHFSFGNSLTVKGGILTVADDLLKNDGKKFLDMMERLAERRMQKEDNTSEQSNNYFQEDEDDDDNFEDEEDDDTRTEEQRMEEGRRMFQIFAARMFEQRVLAAYREKVAQERQQRLLEELEEEDRLREEREAKKQKEREKKKDKKRQMKQQQEAERLAREAKKKAEEEALKREKEKKLALERQKREQERLQKEEEKKHREEERLKKEEEKKRRIKEEKERATEKEKKRKEKEEKERLEKEKLDKELKEKSEQSKLEAKEKIPSPIIPSKTTTSPPPGIPLPENIDDSENRQQVLINALVGPRPLIPTNTTTPIRPQLQQPSFMPSHLDILQNGPTSSLMSNTCSDTTNSSSIMGIFNNRVGSPLESNNPSRQGRSITPIAPIGQPLNGRRVSSVPLHDMQTPSVDSFPSSIKRSSAASPFDTEAGPRSFFSSFLFGEPNRNNSTMPMMAPSEYDMRFAPPPQPLDRRFSNDVSGPNWTNGWTASSALSDNVHGKLFGDALPDRTAMTLERVKIAYQKLNEITQTRIFRGPNNQYHTLVQLHCMMNDLYCDFQVDIRELYEVLIASPLSGFQCVNHAQHGMVVLYDPIVGLRNSPTQNSSLHNNSPPHLNHNLSPNNPSLPPSHPLQGNASALFGSMS
ncbi:hypothetical protein HPULCUR_001514 [Helicostylum pulchrum]|uniref:Stress response protein NST1 n=1 Tax=Helicostylum pulchrum TaxID=562976 RepID=A0ABP9XPG5_9FUNG